MRTEQPPKAVIGSKSALADYREELGIFPWLWPVILAGIAVILLSSWPLSRSGI
ncbi:hypothetical protein LC586_38100 [Nostoc sp. CHAB 5714]|uniref:Uncharacterized protein n=1 Tax=Nostoc favosum CHAB5714 TaxID=2780399 RepID=A0ABS8ILX4_9NOSO|nr:hypothetical protein [Nostoc favosum CHAB5714]